MKFINAFIEFTHEYESPTSFWRWAAYAALAASLRDSVYVDHGIQKTYPNIYVLLLADSAEFRKGVPPALAASLLLAQNNTKVLTGRGSIQGIIEDLSRDLGNPKLGPPLKGGSCILIADELASFFVSDPALIPLITDLYEYRPIFTYRLKTTGITIIKDLCVSMLAASNRTFLNEVYTKSAIYGGLLGRTFIVAPDETRHANSLLDLNLQNYSTAGLTSFLTEIKKLKGPMEVSPDAKALYNSWYEKLYASYSSLADRTGMTQRMHRGVLKLSMILAASDLTKTISLAHMEEAILQVTILRPNYDSFTTVSQKSNQSEIGTLLLEALWADVSHKISRKSLLLAHWAKFTSLELDTLVSTLEAAGLIKSTFESNGEVNYAMTLNCVEIFNRRHLKALAAKNGNIIN